MTLDSTHHHDQDEPEQEHHPIMFQFLKKLFKKPKLSTTDQAFEDYLLTLQRFTPDNPPTPGEDHVDRMLRDVDRYRFNKKQLIEALNLPHFSQISQKLRDKYQAKIYRYDRLITNIYETVAAEDE